MRKRIVTGVLGGAGFLALLWAGQWWYAGLIFVLATVGYAEYCRMKDIHWARPQAWLGMALMWLLLLSGLSRQELISPGWLLREPENVLIGLILFLLLIVFSKNRVPVDEVSYLFTGALYIGYGFSYMIQTRLITDGLAWSLLILAVTWANDTGAYFTGKRFGKRKLWPSISPNKTVEGSAGGLIGSVVVGLAVAWSLPELGSPATAVGIALIVAVVGQVGDLVESAMKRSTGVKDSGTLLPGHGGVLDRFDSLLLVFPAVHILQLI